MVSPEGRAFRRSGHWQPLTPFLPSGRQVAQSYTFGRLLTSAGELLSLLTALTAASFGRCPCDRQPTIVATSFEPIVQRSVRPLSKLAFKAALAAQPGKITCPRSGNDKPCRLDLAVLDDF
jgi:hypothetical protein